MNRTHRAPALRSLLVVSAVVATLLALQAVSPAFAADTARTAALPSDSIYQLRVNLTDQDGKTALLDERRGQPMLVSMFYTTCKSVCPMLIDALRETEAKLSDEERARIPVLMVSFDPTHDTVAVLKQTAEERHLASGQWTLARTDATSARKLAAVLGIQYRALADGEFNHTTALILIDADGRVAGRTTKLSDADPAFVRKIRAALRGSAG
ncbi:MAG: SCO family protein [Caldimonas sp.]